MTTQTFTYCTYKRICCDGTVPWNVILCVPASLVAPHTCTEGSDDQTTEYSYLEAIITKEAKASSICGSTAWNYTITYDDAQLAGDTLITGVYVTGVFCQNCMTSWVEQLVGTDAYITTDPYGLQTFISSHGCQYPLNDGDFALTGWYTDDDGNFIQEPGYTGDIIFDTVADIVGPDGMNLNVGGVDRFQIGATDFTWLDSPGTDSLRLDDDGILYFLKPFPSAIVFSSTFFGIRADTVDGADTKVLSLNAGGEISDEDRGPFIDLYGNDNVPFGGSIIIEGGAVTTGEVHFSLGHATPVFRWSGTVIGNQNIMTLTNDGILNMLRSTGKIVYSNSFFEIHADTVDGADNKAIAICGGGGSSPSRGAFIEIYGNEADGNISFFAGNASANSTITSAIRHASASYRWLDVANLEILTLDNDGILRFLDATTGKIVYSHSFFLLHADTVDGADNKGMSICGGGASSGSRGATVDVLGNEAGGDVGIFGGNIATGHISLNTLHASASIFMSPSTGNSWSFPSGGTFLQDGTNGSDIVFSIDPGVIRQSTADASDTKSVILAGGGGIATTRGATYGAKGNEHATQPGRATISCGEVANARIEMNVPIDTATFAWNIGTGLPEHALMDISALITCRKAAFESTGAGSALLGANCPAVTVAAPFTWLKLKTSDGSVVFLPVWK